MTTPTLDYFTPTPREKASRMRMVVAGLLLLVGVQAWLLISNGYWGRVIQLKLLAALLVVCCIPQVSRSIVASIEHISLMLRDRRRIVAITLLIGSCCYLYLDAMFQQRSFTRKYQDEFSYSLQARMIAHGQLWSRPHPLGEFFDSFQIITEPVYASIYFPGAAMLYAPGVWLGLPFWFIPLLLSGTAVALMYLLTAHLFDDAIGLLGAIMVIANPLFRLQSIMMMAQIPSLVLGLAMVLCWLRWRELRKTLWLGALGLVSGFAAITRPLDALCFAIPIAIALMVETPVRTWWRSGGIIALSALPLLMIQVVFNISATDSAVRTPFGLYADRSFPQTSFGFHEFDPEIRPKSSLTQKQDYYDSVALPFVRGHNLKSALFDWKSSRLRKTVRDCVPHALLTALLPIGFLALRDRLRWMVVLILPAFVGLYVFYAFFLPHYCLTALPATIVLVLCGYDALAKVSGRLRSMVTALLFLSMTMLTISELPEFNRVQKDEYFDGIELQQIEKTLAMITEPAIVLFRYGPGVSPEEEPAYNIETVWPDDARIIRAHDLGERNIKLFDYYSRIAAERVVYRYDRPDGTLTRLGAVRDLVNVN